MKISNYLAKKYFFHKKKQGFVKVITIISTIGVTIGVLALIVVLGVMNGFDQYLREKIVNITSDITLYPNLTDSYLNYKSLKKDIESIDGIKATTAILQGNILLKSKNQAIGVLIKGIEEESSENVLGLSKYIVKGNYDLKEGNSIIIGYYLALNENLKIGDEILVVPPNIKSTPLGILPSFQKFKIKGIFKSGMNEFDYRFV